MKAISEKWPQKEDSIFNMPTPPQNSCIYADWNGYRHAYKQAANILVSKCEEDSSLLDRLIYPIFFLYRHSIELHLKEIFHFGKILGYLNSRFPDNKHDLKELWYKIKPAVLEVKRHSEAYESEPITNEVIDNTYRLLKQISDIDSRSTSFRYSIDRSGNRSLPEDLTRLCLSNLKACMDKISYILGDIEYVLESEFQSRD